MDGSRNQEDAIIYNHYSPGLYYIFTKELRYLKEITVHKLIHVHTKLFNF